jgi:xanthine dehydrogenase small subunit
MAALQLVLNDRALTLDEVDPNLTLLNWLREHAHLTGTKEGCAEGDCGACTVAVLDTRSPFGPSWRAVNACLLPLASLHGARVVTVEGLRSGEAHHPIQAALAERFGSQCGYCTPGFVMSMFEAAHRDDLDADWKFDDQLCGNLCRCTGYRPIREALHAIAGKHPRDGLGEQAQEPQPADQPLEHTAGHRRFSLPTSLAGVFEALRADPDARLIAGATDLGLEITKRDVRFSHLVSLDAVPELHGIVHTEAGWSIGAGVHLSDVERWADAELVPLARMLRFFGSRQIKNRATLGGNLCNASPIGDTAPVLLALNATVVLQAPGSVRRVPLDEFFLAYRKTALRHGEVLTRVEIPRPPEDARLGAYKVSKRREMDISSVALGALIRVDAHGLVTEARLAFGGMAATPARAHKAEQALIGSSWDQPAVESAVAALTQDFHPVSDHRGSAWYRATVAGNLLRGLLLETSRPGCARLPDRPSATIVSPEVGR